MARKTLLVPGFRIRSKVAIYGGGHHSQGPQAWQRFLQELARGTQGVWFEYGDRHGIEDYEGSDREGWTLVHKG